MPPKGKTPTTDGKTRAITDFFRSNMGSGGSAAAGSGSGTGATPAPQQKNDVPTAGSPAGGASAASPAGGKGANIRMPKKAKERANSVWSGTSDDDFGNPHAFGPGDEGEGERGATDPNAAPGSAGNDLDSTFRSDHCVWWSVQYFWSTHVGSGALQRFSG